MIVRFLTCHWPYQAFRFSKMLPVRYRRFAALLGLREGGCSAAIAPSYAHAGRRRDFAPPFRSDRPRVPSIGDLLPSQRPRGVMAGPPRSGQAAPQAAQRRPDLDELRPRLGRPPSSRAPASRRSPRASHLRGGARAPLPHVGARACATSHRTTATGHSGPARPASFPVHARATSAVRSRRGGRPCGRRERRPCRCAAGCRRRNPGTLPDSEPSLPAPSLLWRPKRLKGVSLPSRGVACRSPEMSWSSA